MVNTIAFLIFTHLSYKMVSLEAQLATSYVPHQQCCVECQIDTSW